VSIDASTAAANNQTFSWRGALAFSGVAGQLRYQKQDVSGTASDKTVVFADLNGDRAADFQIELTGLRTLVAGDFIL
jgi:hypothetical protein